MSLKNMMRYRYQEEIRERTAKYHLMSIAFLLLSILGAIVYVTNHPYYIYNGDELPSVIAFAGAVLTPCVIIFLFFRILLLRYEEDLRQSLMMNELLKDRLPEEIIEEE